MKKYLPTAAVVGVALLAALPAQAEDLLTGDVRLACEATLCLSSGYRPHECTASLNRYFSIKHKRLDDTIRGPWIRISSATLGYQWLEQTQE